MSHRVEFVPAPRRAGGRPAGWAVPSPEEPQRIPPGLRGTPPAPPRPEPMGQAGATDCEIDGEALARDVQQRIDDLERDGYEVVTVVPISSGGYGYEREFRRHWESWFSAGAGYGYGYSYTEGVLVLARQR